VPKVGNPAENKEPILHEICSANALLHIRLIFWMKKTQNSNLNSSAPNKAEQKLKTNKKLFFIVDPSK